MNYNLITKLVDIARNGIVQYYNPATHLFDFIVTDNSVKKEKKQLLLIHSLISLLGISNHKDSVSIDYKKSIDKIFELIIRNGSGIREYSLILWLLAKENDARAKRIFEYVNKLSNKIIYRAETMELAWMLTALVFELRRRKDHSEVKSKLLKIVKLLNERFVKRTGLFLHLSKENKTFNLRYNIANFADQIYSIYAISVFTEAAKNDGFLKTAKKCANKICSSQGKTGQWWWHYNALTGEVVGKYPVFSVHQDSMAPLALMALTKVSENNYMSNIQCGLDWISRDNEPGVSMINEDKNFVKRGIKRKGVLSKIQNIATVASKFSMASNISAKYDRPKYLKIMNWEYSYHLGWILYAYNEENKHLWSKL